MSGRPVTPSWSPHRHFGTTGCIAFTDANRLTAALPYVKPHRVFFPLRETSGAALEEAGPRIKSGVTGS